MVRDSKGTTHLAVRPFSPPPPATGPIVDGAATRPPGETDPSPVSRQNSVNRPAGPSDARRVDALAVSEVFPPKVGGSGAWLHELYVRQRGDAVAVLAGHCPGDLEFDAGSTLSIERAPLHGESWSLMNVAGVRYFWSMYSRIGVGIRRHGPRQLHCARVLPEGVAGLAASRRFGVGLVCFVHGEDIEMARSSRETRLLVSRVLAGSDRLVCNSVNTRRLLTEHWTVDAGKIVVLTPGVDVDRHSPELRTPEDRRVLGWGERRVVLTVSRLERRKGHDRMIEALPAIAERVPDVLYAIVGDGPESTALRERADELGVADHVRFHGQLDDDATTRAFRACDLFVLPNRREGSSIEGFGIVLLEAQAAGVPVIAGMSGGTAEALESGSSGLVVDCREASALVEPVAVLLEDEARRRAMGRRGRALMLERFAWQVLAERAEEAVFLPSERP